MENICITVQYIVSFCSVVLSQLYCSSVLLKCCSNENLVRRIPERVAVSDCS